MLKWISEAKKQGLTLTLRHAKIMFCGPSGAGKTSFSKLLRNKPIKKEHKRTPIEKTNQMLVSKVNVTKTEGEQMFKTKWVELDLKLEMKTLRQYLESKQKENQSCGLPVSTEEQVLVNVEKQVASSLTDSSEVIPKIWTLLTLMDTGGQPEFINFLPTINESTALTFLVIDLSKGENCLEDDVVAQDSNPNSRKYKKRHLLESLMLSVKESAAKKPNNPLAKKVEKGKHRPALCFIGTHADVLKKEGSLDTVVEVINKKVNESIYDIDKKEALDVWQINNKTLVPVDNTGQCQTENQIEEQIRFRIYEDILKKLQGVNVPIVWILLELGLRMERKDYIKFNEVVDLAYKISPKMEREELEQALKFYHLMGTLLYFHEEESGMSEIVITNPKWLFKKLTKFVTCNFEIKIKRDKDRFIKDGFFSAQLLEKFPLQDIEKNSFLKLLVYLKIAAQIESKTEFFIPCILPSFDLIAEKQLLEEKLNKSFGNHHETEPLVIKFDACDIPRGFFCFLVVELLQIYVGKNPHPIYNDMKFYDNVLTLRVDDHHYLSIFDKLSFLELQVRVNKDFDFSPSVHQNVLNEVNIALKSICKRFYWSYSEIRFGFYCGTCDISCLNIAVLSKNEPFPSKLPESAKADCHVTMLKGTHKIWFQVCTVNKFCGHIVIIYS